MLKKILKSDKEFLFWLLLTTTLVYATSWRGEFLSDDIIGIQNNPALNKFTLQLTTLNLNNIINSIIYKTFGSTPFWFHLMNTAFHLATVTTVYMLVVLLVIQPSDKNDALNLNINIWLPRLTALLFALHPIETEGITWISGLPYAAYTFFCLAGILTFILADKQPRSKSNLALLWLSALFYALALGASEKAVVLPIILFIYLIVFSQLSWQKIKLTLPTLAILFLYATTLLTHLTQRVAQIATPAYTNSLTIYNPLVQIPISLYSYIKLVFIPAGLTLYHEFTAFPRQEYYLAIGATIIFLLLLLISIGQTMLAKVNKSNYNSLFSFGLLWFVISLTPTLLPINIAWIVAERYAHFSSIGIFLAISTILIKFSPHLQFIKSEAFYKGIVIVIGGILAILTVKRNLEWRSQDTLWPATVRESPLSAYAWNNMGDYYGRHGDIKNSVKAFERARKLRPRYADATHNLGNTYLQIGEATKAAQLFKEALSYNPRLYQSHQKLGIIALEQKHYQAAQTHFLAAIKQNPTPFVDYLNLYIAYDHAGEEEKAQATLLTARRLANQNPQRQQLIQQLLLKLKQEKEKS